MSEKDFTRADITQDFLRDIFEYDASLGRLIWKKSSKGHRAGAVAGTVQKGIGYRQICIGKNGKEIGILEHRAIFLWHFGFLPKQIDHINLDKCDNRIENLRAADSSTNQMNVPVRSFTKSGLKGVHWDKSRNLWLARIKINGKHNFLGRYKTPEEAYEARKAAQHLHGEFARL